MALASCEGKFYSSGSVLAVERPLLALQTLRNRSSCLLCAHCLRFLGGRATQLSLLLGKTCSEVRRRAVDKGEAVQCRCGEVFCSDKCHWRSVKSGHLLECGCISFLQVEGEKTCRYEEEDVRRGLKSAKDFSDHCKATDEVYFAARRVVTGLMASILFAGMEDGDDSHYLPYIGTFSSVSNEQVSSLVEKFKECFGYLRIEESVELKVPTDSEHFGHHESFILLYSSLVNMGVCVEPFLPLLNVSFYSFVVNALRVHLKSIRVDDSPLQQLLTKKCVYGEKVTMNDIDLDQSILSLLSRIKGAEKTKECADLTLLSHLTNASGEHQIKTPTSAIEDGASICMVLLPICSSSTVHSCLPNSHYSVCRDSHFLSGNKLLSSGLPSSTSLTIQIEAVRDFTCINYYKHSENIVVNSSREAISVSVVNHILNSRESRSSQIADLLQSSDKICCSCRRCTWEKSEALDGESNPWFLLSLGYHYMQEGEKGGGEKSYADAIRIFVAIIMKHKTSANYLEVVARAYHAWGASHLNIGDWYRARCVWSYARLYGQHYDMLENELSKMDSYPLVKQLKEGSSPAVSMNDIDSKLGIYVSKQPILTREDCLNVIDWTEEHALRMGSWTTSRHYAVPTTDIPVHVVPPLLNWFNEKLEKTIGPLLHECYTDNPDQCRSAVCIHDVFVCKYRDGGDSDCLDTESAAPQRLLPLHMDQSSHSFVIALNASDEDRSMTSNDVTYSGGGTYFQELDKIVRPDAGCIVTFKGGTTMHGGAPVTSGTRYIIAGFLYFSTFNGLERDVLTHPDAATRMLFKDTSHRENDEETKFVEDLKKQVILNEESQYLQQVYQSANPSCGDSETVTPPNKKAKILFSNDSSHSFSFSF